MTGELLKALASGHTSVQILAAEEIRQLYAAKRVGDPRLVQGLVTALSDTDWRVVERAAQALGEARQSSATIPLILVFLEGQWPAPKAAAVALQMIDPDWADSVLVKASIPDLLEKLQSETWFIRQRAAWALGMSREVSVAPALLGLLDDSEELVQKAARRALERTGRKPLAQGDHLKDTDCVEQWVAVTAADRSAVDGLLALLESTSGGAKKIAARALGRIGEERAIPGLRGMLQDASEDVRKVGAVALRSAGWEPASDEERAGLAIACADWEAVEKLGSAAVTRLMGLLRRDRRELRLRAATILGRIGDSRSVPDLIEALQDPDESVRSGALKALELLQWTPQTDREVTLLALVWQIWEGAASVGRGAVAPLLDSLKNRDARLRELAAKALGEIGDSRAAQPLAELLVDKNPRVLEAATEALVSIGGHDTVIVLLGCATATAPDLRRRVATLLGRLGSQESLDTLRDMLSDRNLTVRRAAADALKTLGWAPITESSHAALAFSLEDWDGVKAVGAGAIDPMLQAVSTGDEEVRRAAVLILGDLGSLGHFVPLKPLVACLHDPDSRVRISTVKALARLGDRGALEPLFALLVRDRWDIAKFAAEALQALDATWMHSGYAKRAIPSLIVELGAQSATTRRHAARVLGVLRCPVGLLLPALSDTDSSVKIAVAEALSRIGDSHAVPFLVSTLNKERNRGVQLAFLEALENLADDEVVSKAREKIPRRQFSRVLGQKTYKGKNVISYLRTSGDAEIEVEMEAGRESFVTPNTEFSAMYPREVAPNTWSPLMAYVFRENAWKEVSVDADNVLGNLRASMRQKREVAKRAIEAGSSITARPMLEGFQFNPSSVSIGLYERWHRFDFRLRATCAPLNTAVNGFLTFTAGGVIVADVPLSIFVGESPSSPPAFSDRVKLYQAIFASYSRSDGHIVDRVERVCKTLGMDYLRDIHALRSGEEWTPCLLSLIERADVFQLFWSTSALASENVSKEWRHAISLERKNFVRPVYWRRPTAPIPRELKHLHFAFEPDFSKESVGRLHNPEGDSSEV